MNNSPASFIPLLHQLADASGEVIRRYFRNVSFDDKNDATPVTIADRGAEEAIRELLNLHRPDDGVWGEEYGAQNMQAEWSWVIDPIDGTKAFIRGLPTFATLIALLHKGVPVMGVIDQPVLRERWIGGVGVPTTMNGTPVRTRACAALDQAVMNATAPGMFKNDNAVPFAALEGACKYSLWGGDAYAYAMLSSGFIDVQVDALMKLHDYAALIPVIESAGGRCTDWSGNPLGFNSDGRVLAVGDARMLLPAIQHLQKK